MVATRISIGAFPCRDHLGGDVFTFEKFHYASSRTDVDIGCGYRANYGAKVSSRRCLPDAASQGDQVDLVSHANDMRPRAHSSVRLWLRLLGDFEAQDGSGSSILPISKKACALLALVAEHMPQPLRRDYAAALLWSTKPRDHAANSLRQALRELQIALATCGQPPVLLTGSGRLMLQAESVWIDIHDPSAIKWQPPVTAERGPLRLCRNLHGLDPALDAHLDRLWKNLVFQQAFVPQAVEHAFVTPPLDRPSDEERTVGGDALDLSPPELSASQSLHPLPSQREDNPGQGWRIAVLPFRSLGQLPERDLSLGMAEEISAAMARFRMPRLTATASFWDGSGPSLDALAKCREFNLDYVISGTIQASGSRIRVTLSLLDVSMDFEVIWTSRFEGTTDDLFTLQNTIASQTVAQIDPELLHRHQFRGESVQAPKAAAHQAVLTAIQGIYRPDRPRFLEARGLLVQAIETDKDYAAAHAWLAYWYIIGMGQGWIDSTDDVIGHASRAAERAINLDPLDARGLTMAGHVKAYFLHDVGAALALQDRAIALNPNLPIAWTFSSWAHIYNGSHATAVEHARTAEALSPADPHVFIAEHAAMTARFFLGDFEIADALAASASERRPRHATALMVRLAIYGHLGRKKEAEACLEALRVLSKEVTIDSIIARPPLQSQDREFYALGLRLAGVPE